MYLHKPTTNDPTYRAWAGAIQRCFNPKNKQYINYGARGITMCDLWRNSFERFHAHMGDKPDGQTLDRMDNDGNYEPGNCRWASPKEQAQNKRPKKLTATDVKLIHQQLAIGTPLINIAPQFHVTPTRIGQIKRKWKAREEREKN